MPPRAKRPCRHRGYIIALADELLAGRVNGGRISAVNGRVITLDRDVDAKPGDRLQLNLPDGQYV
ncbi:TPA: hypothetical protein MYN82_001145 [Klebsiella variicola subsp. variicola]|nr:hypothetical protein [Klebsiella variicola subsp. variicola]